MGLRIKAVSNNYHYDNDLEDMVGESYLSTDIGYIGYKYFRDALISYFSNGKYDLDSLAKNYFSYYDDKTYTVATKLNEFDENEQKYPKVIKYINNLDQLKKSNPKLYACFSLVMHCDCEGEIPYNQVIEFTPYLKEFKGNNKDKFGYAGSDYDFLEDLINICETVIDKKGKLYFS